ncbi:CENPK-like protein [Mya arenaria]|uniref:CENPK-like protein n=1 Tax=Mya arenaria TaxID=6604 RepID=A0ABY7G296_MYAAR|nr:CENPK-like protein [Mya arenaria]
MTTLSGKLHELHTRTEKKHIPATEAGSEGNVQPDIDIIRARCKQLEAEIAVTKTPESIMLLPNDPGVRFNELCADTEQRISQYKECVDFLSAQCSDMHQEYERECKQREELRLIIKAAEAKLTETDSHNLSHAEVCDRVQTKLKKLKDTDKEKKKQMVDFLDRKFPLPDQVTFNRVKKKLGSEERGGQLQTLADLLPLKSIIDMLMKACMSSPNNPYIVVDHRFWPLYVEFLLVYGIAVLHPDDSQRIKLTPFHL